MHIFRSHIIALLQVCELLTVQGFEKILFPVNEFLKDLTKFSKDQKIKDEEIYTMKGRLMWQYNFDYPSMVDINS